MAILYVLYFTAVLSSQTRGESDKEQKLAAMLDDTSYRLQTFASMFLALICISCKFLAEIQKETFNLDTPNLGIFTFHFEHDAHLRLPNKCILLIKI